MVHVMLSEVDIENPQSNVIRTRVELLVMSDELGGVNFRK